MTEQSATTAALDFVNVDQAKLTWFASYLKKWPEKWAGKQPTDQMFMVPLLLGKRPGVEAAHIAMCLRPEGCTVQAFLTAFSCGPANNYRRALVKSGWFSCTVEGKPYAFKLTVTAKGRSKLEKAQTEVATQAADAESEVDAPKVPRKHRQKPAGEQITPEANAQPAAETPTSDDLQVTVTPEGEQAALAAPISEAEASTLPDLSHITA